MKTQSYLVLLILLFTSVFGYSQNKIRIACVGASITYGHFLDDREHNSFPGQLQSLLGNEYIIGNYGVSGTTMLKKGNSPYWKTRQFQEALNSNPNVVFIDLGGNDSKLINRKYLKEINQDCQDMITAFRLLPSHPRVIVLLPTVSFVSDTSEIWDQAIVQLVIPELQRAAYEKNAELLDMHQLLVNHEELMPDKMHPNKQGATIIARRLYELLIQPRDEHFDIFTQLPITKNVGLFAGYQCADFTLSGRMCKVVKPKWSAKGHSWIWRARFWGHEPQTDIALLERGFHVVYCDVAELFGNDKALSIWNDYYHLLTHAGLGKKSVMEGMSRGGVYIYRWAATYPKRVAAIYADAPVLDLKSWPGGKGQSKGSPTDWERFKKDFNFKTEEEAISFKGNPIDLTGKIVKAGFPMLHVVGDADDVVPIAENTTPFEQKIIEAGGSIKVIHKPGVNHHPHSLQNPQPIVDFILRSSKQKMK